MKKQLAYALLALLVLFAPFAAVPTASAQGRQDSLVDVWVFEDVDLNGVYSNGDHGLHEINMSLYNKDTRETRYGGTDQGDNWYEINTAGRFVTQVDASQLEPTYRLNSIQCRHTVSNLLYKGCSYNLPKWEAKFKLPLVTRINIFYGLVRE